MGRTPYTEDDLNKAIERARRGLKYGPSTLPIETRKNACRFVVTTAQNSNGKRLNVRCHCMAPWRAGPSYYAYDALATVSSMSDAVAVWAVHCDEVAKYG